MRISPVWRLSSFLASASLYSVPIITKPDSETQANVEIPTPSLEIAYFDTSLFDTHNNTAEMATLSSDLIWEITRKCRSVLEEATKSGNVGVKIQDQAHGRARRAFGLMMRF